MAVVTGQSLMHNLSGTLGGNVVFKKYKNKTVVSMKATRRRKKNSELQNVYLNKFKDAAKYAHTILRDPIKYEQYKKLAKKLNKHSAYNLAISEYMLSISIETKETAEPAKASKKHITLTVTKKKFKVEKVTVELISPNGETIITRSANRVSSTDWALKLPEQPHKGSTLIVTATDTHNLSTTKYLQY